MTVYYSSNHRCSSDNASAHVIGSYHSTYFSTSRSRPRYTLAMNLLKGDFITYPLSKIQGPLNQTFFENIMTEYNRA